MINCIKSSHIVWGRVKQSDAVSGSAYMHMFSSTQMLQEGRPLPGTKSGLLSEETQALTKQEVSLGRDGRSESGRVREPRRTALRAASGVTVMGLVSGLSLANHSDSESFLVAHALLSHDGGFWEMVGHVVSHFDLFQTLTICGGLLVPCSSLEPPVIK